MAFGAFSDIKNIFAAQEKSPYEKLFKITVVDFAVINDFKVKPKKQKK